MNNKNPKKVLEHIVKLQILAGKANPAPPVGTALGPKGVNMMDFCKQFNEKTKNFGDDLIPVEIFIYKDKSFTFKIKKPPISFLIKKYVKIASGSKEPGRNIVAKLTIEDVRKLAEYKMEDLNAYSVEQAMKMVIGTARSMGIETSEDSEEKL